MIFAAAFFVSGRPWPKQTVFASSAASLRMLRRASVDVDGEDLRHLAELGQAR